MIFIFISEPELYKRLDYFNEILEDNLYEQNHLGLIKELPPYLKIVLNSFDNNPQQSIDEILNNNTIDSNEFKTEILNLAMNFLQSPPVIFLCHCPCEIARKINAFIENEFIEDEIKNKIFFFPYTIDGEDSIYRIPISNFSPENLCDIVVNGIEELNEENFPFKYKILEAWKK